MTATNRPVENGADADNLLDLIDRALVIADRMDLSLVGIHLDQAREALQAHAAKALGPGGD